jgi:hypothetical protein
MRKTVTAEHRRLAENREDRRWYRWGPYVSERQWGTVREDYSEDGDAWSYVTHDAARSRAYRWGEDGIAGVCDESQNLCLALALWNGHDPILKERLFGLTNAQGNHGEDVKEHYYYLDATPTHSYLKLLYKYPQTEYPYARLVEENAERGREAPEFELSDTGVFDDDRYFDVVLEYAKASPDDLLMLVTAHNRGPDDAPLWLLPQLWFRNTWSWSDDAERPQLEADATGRVRVSHGRLGPFEMHAEGSPDLLFTENETNAARLFGASPADTNRYRKDAFHEYLVDGRSAAVNPERRGTKAGILYRETVSAAGSVSIRLRLGAARPEAPHSGAGENDAAAEVGDVAGGFADFDTIIEQRRAEADEFYASLHPLQADAEERRLQRQAYAGMIWSKQFYYYDVRDWLKGDSARPAPPPGRHYGRNHDWEHLNNADVLSMPDKWEYPWYAAWDLAFHAIPLARLDPEFAKEQLVLLTREWYMHPNGQLPAYEWNFGDVNPPVHAWAAWRVYEIDREIQGSADRAFLERVFHKLLLNFTWWVNRKDVDELNVFQGGFLGLDNIGVFDRSASLPAGGHIDQADGTSWMGMYCLNMLRIALELALDNPVYEDIATKFFEHFLDIAHAMTNMGGEGIGLWDEEDEFFYDVLHLPEGHRQLKVRSMVGLSPLFAVEVLEPETMARLPGFEHRLRWFLRNRPERAALVSRWEVPGAGERRLLSLLRGHRMKRLLARMLDETEFLSEYGVRALSKHHLAEPYVLECGGERHTVAYEPAESRSGLFGGNSNWRGPIWFPTNFLLIESLCRFHRYYGDEFKIECPTGSGNYLTIRQVALELAQRLCGIFLSDAEGGRPVYGQYERLAADPHFRDHLLFFEYFHGDSGRGVGASHQTGWTGLAAELVALVRSEAAAM